MNDFIGSLTFFFVLFNPFLMSIYLLDLIRDLDAKSLYRVLLRASLISAAVFIPMGWVGKPFFTDVLYVRFESFQIFGGILFIVIGVRYIFRGAASLREMRGDVKHLAGSVAMPFMIGPGTLSAAVLIGQKHSWTVSASVILLGLLLSLLVLMLFKIIHDRLKKRNAEFIERYIDIVGRVSALYIGTFAIDMIANGVRGWLDIG